MIKKIGIFGFVSLIIIAISYGAANFFILPYMYKSYIEEQGIPVYPRSKITVGKLIINSNMIGVEFRNDFRDYFDNKDKAFSITSDDSIDNVIKFYEENLGERAKYSPSSTFIKVGDKNMIQFSASKQGTQIIIKIPNPAGDFSSTKVDLYNF